MKREVLLGVLGAAFLVVLAASIVGTGVLRESNPYPEHDWRSGFNSSQRESLKSLSGERLFVFIRDVSSASPFCSDEATGSPNDDLVLAGLLQSSRTECRGKRYSLTASNGGAIFIEAFMAVATEKALGLAGEMHLSDHELEFLQHMDASSMLLFSSTFGSVWEDRPRRFFRQCIEEEEFVQNFEPWAAYEQAGFIQVSNEECNDRPFAVTASPEGEALAIAFLDALEVFARDESLNAN